MEMLNFFLHCQVLDNALGTKMPEGVGSISCTANILPLILMECESRRNHYIMFICNENNMQAIHYHVHPICEIKASQRALFSARRSLRQWYFSSNTYGHRHASSVHIASADQQLAFHKRRRFLVTVLVKGIRR